MGHDSGWVLDWEMRELKKICSKLNVPIVRPIWKHSYAPQSVFFSNQFFLQKDDWKKLLPNRIGFAYFHGMPNTGDDGLDRVYGALEKHHERIARIQVSHMEMRDMTLETGIDPSKVFISPIGVNLNYFTFRSLEQKWDARVKLGIPQSAFVIGFTLKDVVADDKQSNFSPRIYLNPSNMTIPQYNFRLGYFINESWSISLGADHMKYVARPNQIVKIAGYIHETNSGYDGEYNDNSVILGKGFLEF